MWWSTIRRKPVYVSQPQGPENLVTWARPLLTSREGLDRLIDPALGGNYDFDDVAKVAAIASMCVHVETSQRPFMGEVVQALKLIYNDMDETCKDSCSQRESSSDSEYQGDLCPESPWWNRSTSRLNYGQASSFVTMEYSVDPVYDLQRHHSTSSLVGRMDSIARLSRSAPLRTKRRRAAFYALRGSKSEHAHLPRRHSMNG